LIPRSNTTSRELVEQSLAAIRDPSGEGARVFLKVYDTEALAAADRADADGNARVLSGIPISIKDLFDESGIVTTGGSTFLREAPPAAGDCPVVERLRRAGAIIIGRTNLTEFAYSALGINPHCGTPKNAFDRATGRVPGGSTSGGAISVTDGMAVVAIGTDTGGSVRIPAALNGLVGFKPTARRVPRDGVLPLSTSLDSVGPIGRSVADCILLDAVLSGDNQGIELNTSVNGLRLAVPATVFLDDLSPAVADAFASALSRLSSAGAKIIDVPMKEFAQAAEVNPRGAISSYEAYSFHKNWIAEHRDEYDPRVLARILPGESISPETYEAILKSRERFIDTVNAVATAYDALLMPTVPDIAPTIAEATKDDETYFRMNSRLLRNPSIVNLFDGCALSIPCHEPGTAPVGLMIAGTQNTDLHILMVGKAIERTIAPG
jgi:aspartyl-tRNA(Asn)/glutamyl-tRNA(Gln) amidotransferase subunit A